MGTGLIDICTSNNATFTPYLTINYTSLAGLENYLAYEQQSAGRAGTGYVSLYNGNLIFEHSDTVTNGKLLPVSLTHYYNSCDSDHNYFGAGRGWKLNLQQYLYRETILDDPNNTNTGTTYYVYVDSPYGNCMQSRW